MDRRLTLEDLRRLVKGAVVREEEPGVFGFYRLTEAQYRFFNWEEELRFHPRMDATAGVCLDFYTDASEICLDYQVFEMADRDMLQLDVYQNRVMLQSLVEVPCLHPQGTLRICPERDGRWNRITIWLPYMSNTRLSRIILANGEYRSLEEGTPDGSFPGRIRKKLLCYGDSITQGYDARHPSQTYAAIVSRSLDLELWNAGISGYIFEEQLLDWALPFQPDLVTVAFGTNDWNWAQDETQAFEKAEAYLERINHMYPGIHRYYLSPVWRGDTAVPTLAGEFRPFCQRLLILAAQKGFRTVDGFGSVPHCKEYLADQLLHPNDAGMAHYGQRVSVIVAREHPTIGTP